MSEGQSNFSLPTQIWSISGLPRLRRAFLAPQSRRWDLRRKLVTTSKLFLGRIAAWSRWRSGHLLRGAQAGIRSAVAGRRADCGNDWSFIPPRRRLNHNCVRIAGAGQELANFLALTDFVAPESNK